jgi:predicted signal transduction protein with EAL and GGDEF domain
MSRSKSMPAHVDIRHFRSLVIVAIAIVAAAVLALGLTIWGLRADATEDKKLGVSIVLDDFGTGYSSLSYLRLFPFDKIKIDQSFVREMPYRSDCAAIVCAIAGLGRELDMVTVAEGVETEEQLALVRASGCRQAQGFLFSRPCPASQLVFACNNVVELRRARPQ